MIDESDFLKFCRKKNDSGFDEIKEYVDQKKPNSLRVWYTNGTTPIHEAVKSNSIKIVKLLIEKGMNPMLRNKTVGAKTPLVLAIEKGFIEIAELILNSDKVKPLKSKRFSEFTALGRNSDISILDFGKIAKLLVKNGFDINLLDESDQTLVTYCIMKGNLDRIQSALNAGANINNPNRLPLRYALHRSEFEIKNINEIVKLLLKNGAELVYDYGGTQFKAFEEIIIRENFEIYNHIIDNYNGEEFIVNDDDILQLLFEEKNIEFFKPLWHIPKIQKFIIDSGMTKALPQEVQDVFIF